MNNNITKAVQAGIVLSGIFIFLCLTATAITYSSMPGQTYCDQAIGDSDCHS